MFGKSYTYKDWYIFPDTTLDNLIVDDCQSSVTGTCENTKTVEECIQICRDNQPCFAGYFIQTPDNKNICVPIKKISNSRVEGPYYRLRNKNIYPELKNMKSYVFTNKMYDYPPDHANNIFYTDKFVLTNLVSQKSFGLSEDNKISNVVTLTTKPINIQFLPKNIFRTYLSQYIIVKNGDEVIINIPNSAYILKDNTENISWALILASLEGSNNTFRVFSTDKNKKIGDFLNYQDTLYFTSQGNLVIYDAEMETIITTPTSIENEISKNNNMYFKIIPKIHAYYCDGECKKVMLENTEMSQEKAKYKGVRVFRSPFCWGQCNSPGKTSLWIWFLVGICIICIVIIAKRYVF